MTLWHRLLAAGVSEDEATTLMHGYAHELAERQREDIDYDSGNTTPDFIAGRLSGADLIDPQEQQPPVGEYRLSTR